ncbi:MAG: glucose-6-phosphate isomerase [Verrucomicrobiales bacterium]|nr:glucose-6-phosphate isomerase [Verrucomicrobiales bacterium]
MPTNWDNYNERLLRYPELGFSIDTSRMGYDNGFFASLQPEIEQAFFDMRELEKGEIANPDEKNDEGEQGRQVGHYWLRNSELAPPVYAEWIEKVKADVVKFSQDILSGKHRATNDNSFRHVLLIGIGGSALGPQLVADALLPANAPVSLHFLDNTDPNGIDRTFDTIGDGIAETLVVVTSKSGGTAETRNGMLEAEKRFADAGVDFSKQAVAVTGEGSALDRHAIENGWITRFPMTDWIGGRTSVMSAVGLLPAALTGLDIEAFLRGAGTMDSRTRSEEVEENASMLLALMWHYAGGGKGKKDMVIIPYCDRLELMSKYLQQLVMESLGKEYERGNEEKAEQGIAVYGNKGSTDQHAYIQQLRDGLHNFFATFIEIQRLREPGKSIIVDDRGSLTGDYLQGFLRGTRSALFEKGRESITLTFQELNAYTLGALIALYERAVSFYASLVNINAYHQPGVEAGKKAAGSFLDIVEKVRGFLTGDCTESNAKTVAEAIGESDVEAVFHALNHLAANGEALHTPGPQAKDDTFTACA